MVRRTRALRAARCLPAPACASRAARARGSSKLGYPCIARACGTITRIPACLFATPSIPGTLRGNSKEAGQRRRCWAASRRTLRPSDSWSGAGGTGTCYSGSAAVIDGHLQADWISESFFALPPFPPNFAANLLPRMVRAATRRTSGFGS
jgi:hypothetical protein